MVTTFALACFDLHLAPMMMKGNASHVIDGFGSCCHVCSSVNGVEDAHKNNDRGCDITRAARFAKSAQISAGISMRVPIQGRDIRPVQK